MKPLITPSVHLNGDSKATLIDQATDVRVACKVLLDALSNAVPNGRNYYVQKDNPLEKARDAHHERMLVVDKISKEFLQLAIDISEGSKS